MCTFSTICLLFAGHSAAFAFLPFPSRAPGFRYPLALASSLNSMADKVLLAPKWPPEWCYTANDFARQDESDDDVFYESPRLVSAKFKLMI
jgi:hypothetical protein